MHSHVVSEVDLATSASCPVLHWSEVLRTVIFPKETISTEALTGSVGDMVTTLLIIVVSPSALRTDAWPTAELFVNVQLRIFSSDAPAATNAT